MTMPRLIPGTLPSGTRRRVPKVSKSKRVPLWTVEPDGQLFSGVIRVPVRLVNTPEHTNARMEFDKLIDDNLTRWVEWRKRRGWILSGEVEVNGPFEPPEGDRIGKRQERAEEVIGRNPDAGAVKDFDHAEEFKWFIAEARFLRDEPVFVRLDDMLEMRHMALTYGVDPDRDPPRQNYLPPAKDYLEFEGGLDPMAVAEERRQRLGLKREDYLMGELKEPL